MFSTHTSMQKKQKSDAKEKGICFNASQLLKHKREGIFNSHQWYGQSDLLNLSQTKSGEQKFNTLIYHLLRRKKPFAFVLLL